jgi:hypothetical protein
VKKLILFTVVVSLLALATSISEIVSGAGEQGGSSEGLADKETCVSEVVLRAPWAEKNLVYDGEESPSGQFGVYQTTVPDSLKDQLDAGISEGPTSFAVAPNGDIYITDPLNRRIQRFDGSGSLVKVIPIPPYEGSRSRGNYQRDWGLVCADRYDNVYLLWWEDYTEQVVCQYNQQGMLLKSYPLFEEVRLGGAGMKLRCVDGDTLVLQYGRKAGAKQILSSLAEYLAKRGPATPFTFQLGTADLVFAQPRQRATLKQGVVIPGPGLSGAEMPGSATTVGESWGPIPWNHDFINGQGDFYSYSSSKRGIKIVRWRKP